MLSAWGLSACRSSEAVDQSGGSDTGNPYGDENDGEVGTAGGCDVQKTELALDAQTALGFSPEDVADLVSGERTEALAWVPNGGVEYGPESGRSMITLSVQALGGARLIDREPSNPAGGNGPGGALLAPLDGCTDSLEVDVRIVVTTAGGALAETVDTVVQASLPDFASASFRIDLTAVAGSFEADPRAPGNSTVTRTSLTGQFGFNATGMVGAFGLQSEFRSLDGSSVGQGGAGEIAHFPADTYCGQPTAFSVLADQSVRGLSLATALERLNGESPHAVRYATGSASELALSFTSAEERVCVNFGRDQYYNGEPDGAILSFPGVADLTSLDGRVDGAFPVDIVAQSLGGGLRVSAEARRQTNDLNEASGLPAGFAIQDGVDFSRHDGGAVVFQSSVSAAASGGSLVVNGLDIPACLTTPPPPDPNGMSSPGCSGIALVPLWSASWGNLQ